MSEEFALCWNNFTENITTGFQSLLVRGDLCDVTLAVEGKLLKAHKIVLSICSPYFQEMFTTMQPNQHPILILKDMSSKLVANLLEFMYQGMVNVKQDELKAFMKIAETLQIKGLTSTSKEPKKNSADAMKSTGTKRSQENNDTSPRPRSKERRVNIDLTDDDVPVNSDEQFQVIPFPEISLVESRFDMSSKSRESMDTHQSSCNLKIGESQSLSNFASFDFPGDSSPLVEAPAKNSSAQSEFPNEPSGSNITMLSSTSLLHGNCIFNRNNTVATQAGLKTYWLCKSYRISMCKARCITHQGKVISATGVHNHLPHMSNKLQELPPGHTPNVFNPSASGHEFPSNANMSGLHQNSRILMTQPPYPYFPHSMNQQMIEQQSDSNITPIDTCHNISQQNTSPASDAKMSFNSASNHVPCKMENV